MKIPAHTARAHLPARDRRVDTTAVLNMAARRRPARRYADMNAVAGMDVDLNLHWPDSWVKNHYTHIKPGPLRRLRKATDAELHRAPDLTPWSKARQYRKRVGRGRWVRPYTVLQRQRQAHRRRVTICWELKSRAYGQRLYATRIVHAVKLSGWRGYFMTLVTMRAWGPKLAQIKQAGGQTALLPHGARRTPVIEQGLKVYGKYIDRYWGAWHR